MTIEPDRGMSPTVAGDCHWHVARVVAQRGLRLLGGVFGCGRGFNSLITVWQLRHSNLSKCVRCSCDLLACMATPQIGQ